MTYPARPPCRRIPMLVLVNEATASSSGSSPARSSSTSARLSSARKRTAKAACKPSSRCALQQRTPLDNCALYTPADVTINKHGILPTSRCRSIKRIWFALHDQFAKSWEDDAAKHDRQSRQRHRRRGERHDRRDVWLKGSKSFAKTPCGRTSSRSTTKTRRSRRCRGRSVIPTRGL